MRDVHHRLLGLAAAAFSLIAAGTVQAQSLDPAGSGAVSGALLWLQGTLLGTVATAAAVIAVAAVGFATLTGRMNWRHAATVVLGIFILFGATAIVAGIRQTAGGL